MSFDLEIQFVLITTSCANVVSRAKQIEITENECFELLFFHVAMQTIMFGDSSDQNDLFPLQVMLNYANVDVCSIGFVDDL